jgi:hypothetical protein
VRSAYTTHTLPFPERAAATTTTTTTTTAMVDVAPAAAAAAANATALATVVEDTNLPRITFVTLRGRNR